MGASGDAVDHLQMLGPKTANHLEMLQAETRQCYMAWQASARHPGRSILGYCLFIRLLTRSFENREAGRRLLGVYCIVDEYPLPKLLLVVCPPRNLPQFVSILLYVNG